MDLWPHQARGVDDVLRAYARGARRLCLTSPTGGGKSIMMRQIARHRLAQGDGVLLLTNRIMLRDQLSQAFDDAGFDHGIRAAGHGLHTEYPLQIGSIQTEHSRSLKRKVWALHPARLVILDEAHLHNNPTAREVLDAYVGIGANYLLVTATPLDLDDMAEELIVAGTPSELRAYTPPALVLAHHYGPDEPDLRAFKNVREGVDLSEADASKAMMTPGIFGRVLHWFNKLNPDRKPSLLFAPGVGESIWFAQQFAAEGIRSAHIDGEHVWLDGRLLASTPELRRQILEGSRDGTIPVLCNRFVLREGIDCPWLRHGIFATVFGSLQSYLQSGGRLLRASPGKDSVTVQDHGGNWWRHGSLNADRKWLLGLTAAEAYARRADDFRYRKCRVCKTPLDAGALCERCKAAAVDQPKACPQCSRILVRGKCVCGYAGTKFARKVVQADGSLKELTGQPFRPRTIHAGPDGPKLWERMYYRARSPKWNATFRQAAALFAEENDWRWPDPTWPLMPKDERDWYRSVSDVKPEDLR